MLRHGVIVLVCVLGLLVAAGPAQAAPPADLSDCVKRNPDGSVTISPSGCAGQADPLRQELYEQCLWVEGNPIFNDLDIYCELILA